MIEFVIERERGGVVWHERVGDFGVDAERAWRR
jgi:hypothetical protein